jgi:hypothetical protein
MCGVSVFLYLESQTSAYLPSCADLCPSGVVFESLG